MDEAAGQNEGGAVRRRTSGLPLHAMAGLDERLTAFQGADFSSARGLTQAARPAATPRAAKPAPGLTLLALIVVAAVQVAWLGLLFLLVLRVIHG